MDNEEELRRNPLAKEKFLEGNRQRWCLVFVVIGLLIMGLTAYGGLKDPAPFLGFFTGIGVTFILGSSATAVMNSYKIESVSEGKRLTEDKTLKQEKLEQKITIEIDIDGDVTDETEDGAPEIKPFSQRAEDE